MVTHNREEAFTIGQRVLVMENGQIDMIGLPEEIREYFNKRAPSAGDEFEVDKQRTRKG